MGHKTYQWAVVGAGPAGIAAVGKLLDAEIPADAILWVDPYFNVGDLGQHWRHVSSNTTVRLFIDFLTAVKAFQYDRRNEVFALNRLPLEQTCELSCVVAPLLSVTHQLRQQVTSATEAIHTLTHAERQWCLEGGTETFFANQVILATGAEPKKLHYPDIPSIPFEEAIDKQKLAQHVNANQTIAVFGSSHSAMIILRHLVEGNVKKIINFYRAPHRYAVNQGDWILFDNTGLKGETAQWTREHIDGKQPANLARYLVSDVALERLLSLCDKAIYAVGFERRNSLVVKGLADIDYNPHVGIIAPGLFGLGIAYPELKADPFGHAEMQVGLWKFMTYLNKVMPIWLNYPA